VAGSSADGVVMKKGDRVRVKIGAERSYYATIVGEMRDGHSWYVIKDGTTSKRGIHKSFCKEIEHADSAERSDHRGR